MRLSMLLGLLVLLASLSAHAAIQVYDFENPENERRFRELSHQLRCLVCQNQSLAESNADLAADMREKIYTMLRDGADDSEIVDYMVARYGDFVLYRPPLKDSTYLLWFGPAALALVAIGVIVVLIRKQKERASPSISEAERARLRDLLEGQSSGRGRFDRDDPGPRQR